MSESYIALFGKWSEPLQTQIRFNYQPNEVLQKIYGRGQYVPWESVLRLMSGGHFRLGKTCSCGEKRMRLYAGTGEIPWGDDHDLEVCLKCRIQICYGILC